MPPSGSMRHVISSMRLKRAGSMAGLLHVDDAAADQRPSLSCATRRAVKVAPLGSQAGAWRATSTGSPQRRPSRCSPSIFTSWRPNSIVRVAISKMMAFSHSTKSISMSEASQLTSTAVVAATGASVTTAVKASRPVRKLPPPLRRIRVRPHRRRAEKVPKWRCPRLAPDRSVERACKTEAKCRPGGGRGSTCSVELAARPSEQRQGLFDIIGNEGRAEQIFGGPLVARTSCLEPQLAPVFDTAVAAPKPH
jgi:hypothetical protein